MSPESSGTNAFENGGGAAGVDESLPENQLYVKEYYRCRFRALPRDFRWTNHGMQTSEQMAALLNQQDIFVDLPHYQAMGWTAMEAMASGSAVVVPQAGGSGSFAVHGENALVANTSRQSEGLEAIESLIAHPDGLAGMRRRALSDIVRFCPEQAAFNYVAYPL